MSRASTLMLKKFMYGDPGLVDVQVVNLEFKEVLGRRSWS